MTMKTFLAALVAAASLAVATGCAWLEETPATPQEEYAEVYCAEFAAYRSGYGVEWEQIQFRRSEAQFDAFITTMFENPVFRGGSTIAWIIAMMVKYYNSRNRDCWAVRMVSRDD